MMESRIKRYDHETWHFLRDELKCTEDWEIINEDFQGVTVKMNLFDLGEILFEPEESGGSDNRSLADWHEAWLEYQGITRGEK